MQPALAKGLFPFQQRHWPKRSKIQITFSCFYFVRCFMELGVLSNVAAHPRISAASAVRALGRDAIIESLFPGQAAKTNTRVPASFEYYNGDAVFDLSYDPEAAKALFDEANFDYSREVKLACYYSDETTGLFMDSVCEYLKQVGVTASWYLMTGDITAQLYDAPTYDLVYAGLSAMTVEEAFNPYESVNHKNSVSSKILPVGITDLDEHIHELWQTSDSARRTELLKEMQVIESEKFFWYMPMFSIRNLHVFNTARVNLPPELELSNEWSNYERYIDKWTLNHGE